MYASFSLRSHPESPPCHALGASAPSGEDVPAWAWDKQELKPALHVPGKGQPFLHPTTAPRPSLAQAGVPGLPQCRGIAGIAQPGAATPALPSLRAGKQGWRLAPSQATPAMQPRPHAKADPPCAWHSPAVPRRSLAETWGVLVAVLGGKVPALETRGSDVKEFQPCPAHP